MSAVASIRRHPRGGYTWMYWENWSTTAPPEPGDAAISYDSIDQAMTAAGIPCVLHYELWPDLEKAEPGARIAYTPRRAALYEAADLIDGERDSTYGSPRENFGRAIAMWQVLFPERQWSLGDVSRAMIALKLARDVHSGKRDTFVDIAGYAACGVEVENL